MILEEEKFYPVIKAEPAGEAGTEEMKASGGQNPAKGQGAKDGRHTAVNQQDDFLHGTDFTFPLFQDAYHQPSAHAGTNQAVCLPCLQGCYPIGQSGK